jgi:cytochrome c-type biogenesis protein
MPVGTYALGGLAGLLSTLSPCVLPLLPIVVGSAAAAHRFGPLALAGGVTLSFVAVGMFVATIGFSIGLDGDLFRAAAAVIMVAVGALLLSYGLQQRFAAVASPLGAAADGLLTRIAPSGLAGQFVIGLLLGAVWSPCVGPTMGAAVTLAAQREALPQVAGVMMMFGLGAAFPLLLIGSLSREALLRWRGRLAAASQTGKYILGAALLAIGAAILTGIDKILETALVEISPAWLTDLTTRF